MIFDTHAHYDSEQFDEDREILLASMKEAGVGMIVNVAASYESCFEVTKLAQKYAFMYAAVGVHPDEVGELNEETFSWLREQLKRPKIVAVGEIGLDYYWDKEKRELQKEWFVRQLRLARELKKPVVIHSREAAADTMEILKAEVTDEIFYEMHCYSYSPEMAREYLKMGFYLGIGGVLTFKNAKKLKEVAEEAPIEKLLLETDCPYLAPVPNRGKRNDSRNIRYVAEELAKIKGMTTEEGIRITEKNAKRFYRISEENA